MIRRILVAFVVWCFSASLALAALAIDSGSPSGVGGTGGSNANTQTTLATSTGLTLSNAGDIVIIDIILEKEATGTPGCTSVSDGTNTYALRNRSSYTQTNGTPIQVTVERWWAYSPSTLTLAVITASCATASGFTNGVINTYGVTGFTGTAYQTNPWDQSAATALGWAATNTSLTGSVITSNSYSNSASAAMLISSGGTIANTGSNLNGGQPATLAGSSTTNFAGTNLTSFGGFGVRFGDAVKTVAVVTGPGTATISNAISWEGWVILPDILAQAGGSGGGGGSTSPPPNYTVFGIGP